MPMFNKKIFVDTGQLRQNGAILDQLLAMTYFLRSYSIYTISWDRLRVLINGHFHTTYWLSILRSRIPKTRLSLSLGALYDHNSILCVFVPVLSCHSTIKILWHDFCQKRDP